MIKFLAYVAVLYAIVIGLFIASALYVFNQTGGQRTSTTTGTNVTVENNSCLAASNSSLSPRSEHSKTRIQGWLGFEFIEINSKMAKILGVKEKRGEFLVTYVFPEGPADKAGIGGGNNITMFDWDGVKLGGDIILRIDNKTFRNGDTLIHYIQSHKSIDDNINLTLIRDEQLKEITTRLAERPDFLIYENPNYGMRIQYPSNWIKMEQGLDSDKDRVVSPDIVAFHSPDEILPEELVINVHEFKLTLDRYTDETIKNIVQNLVDPKIMSSRQTMLANNPAHELVIIFKELGKYDTYLVNVWTVQDDKVYDIRYLSDLGRSYACFPIAQKMINSFKISNLTTMPLSPNSNNQ